MIGEELGENILSLFEGFRVTVGRHSLSNAARESLGDGCGVNQIDGNFEVGHRCLSFSTTQLIGPLFQVFQG